MPRGVRYLGLVVLCLAAWVTLAPLIAYRLPFVFVLADVLLLTALTFGVVRITRHE